MKRNWMIIIFVGLIIFSTTEANALIFINEFLADPPNGIAGDANGDGVRSSSDDEFVELLNTGSSAVDISNWTLADGTQIRHTFAVGSVLSPEERLVIFGGGILNPSSYWAVTATGHSLSLNNTGDQIILRNVLNQIIDQVIYGSEAGFDQSLTRFPEGSESFAKHLSVSGAGLAFSPGADVEGHFHPTHAEIPEPGTFFLLPLLGLISNAAGKFRRKKESRSNHNDCVQNLRRVEFSASRICRRYEK